MDLWSHAGQWTGKTPEDVSRPSLTAALVMWFTVLLPYAGLAALLAWSWRTGPAWLDLAFLVVSYLAVGFGVTVGYHRLLAHRAFATWRWLEALLLILGCMAMQGPPVRWAATHRRHHQKSDDDGDPHSPHHHGSGVGGIVRGLWHAHTGWLLCPDLPDTERSCGDMIASPDRPLRRPLLRACGCSSASRSRSPLARPSRGRSSAASSACCGPPSCGSRLMHHATWSVNSICHVFGYRNFRSGDESRNNPVVAMLSLGEGWHNNHHAFPTSARHGMRWYEFDASYVLIRSLELARRRVGRPPPVGRRAAGEGDPRPCW